MVSDLLSQFSDEELDQLKRDPALVALFSDQGDSPSMPNKDNLLKLFRDVIDFKPEDFDKISRTGNLKEFEFGMLPLTVRAYLSIATYADTEKLPFVSAYLRNQSNVILNTSLSRMAALLKLIVTQRKFTGLIEPKRTEVKSGLFGEKTVESGGEE